MQALKVETLNVVQAGRGHENAAGRQARGRQRSAMLTAVRHTGRAGPPVLPAYFICTLPETLMLTSALPPSVGRPSTMPDEATFAIWARAMGMGE